MDEWHVGECHEQYLDTSQLSGWQARRHQFIFSEAYGIRCMSFATW